MREWPERVQPFVPAPWLPGGDLQTIVGYYLPAAPLPAETRRHVIRLGDGDELVLHEDPVAVPRAAVLLLHGLGGDAAAPYMLRLSALFRKQGLAVFRLDHRGAGAGKGRARQLYHSGRSEDVSAALQKATAIAAGLPVFAVGFSLSGNMLLKLLGEQKEPIPDALTGAVAINPPIDLAMCAQSLSRPRNKLYDLRFVGRVVDAMKERERDFPIDGGLDLKRIGSLFEFDDRITAPLSGFESAEDYYARCQAKQHFAKIRTPALLLASANDPFIPLETFENLPVNSRVHVHITKSGGHMGFISRDVTPHGNRRWMDYAVADFVQTRLDRRTTWMLETG